MCQTDDTTCQKMQKQNKYKNGNTNLVITTPKKEGLMHVKQKCKSKEKLLSKIKTNNNMFSLHFHNTRFRCTRFQNYYTRFRHTRFPVTHVLLQHVFSFYCDDTHVFVTHVFRRKTHVFTTHVFRITTHVFATHVFR